MQIPQESSLTVSLKIATAFKEEEEKVVPTVMALIWTWSAVFLGSAEKT